MRWLVLCLGKAGIACLGTWDPSLSVRIFTKDSVCSLIRDLIGLVDKNGVLTSFGYLSKAFTLEIVLCHTNTSLCSCSLIAGTLLLVFSEARGVTQLLLHRQSVTMWLSHRLRWCLTLTLPAASELFRFFSAL